MVDLAPDITNVTFEDNSDEAMQIWVDAVGAKQCSWQAVLAGAVGTYGFIRQFELQERMVDCAEAQKEQAQEYLELTQQQYEEVTRPIFDCIKEAFTTAEDCYAQFEKEFVELALNCPVPEPDYVSQEGRVLGVVQAQFDNALKQRRRQLGKHETGRCKSENVRFALATATAKTDALNSAYRYEEARRDRWDEIYWNRKVQGMAIAQGAIGRTYASLTASGNVVNSGLGVIGNAFGRSLDAAGQLSAATSGLSDLFGTLANGAFQFAGFQSFGRPGFGGASPGFGGGFGSPFGNIGANGSIAGFVSNGANQFGGILSGLFSGGQPPALAGFGGVGNGGP